jgi:hypothetical protein
MHEIILQKLDLSSVSIRISDQSTGGEISTPLTLQPSHRQKVIWKERIERKKQ